MKTKPPEANRVHRPAVRRRPRRPFPAWNAVSKRAETAGTCGSAARTASIPASARGWCSGARSVSSPMPATTPPVAAVNRCPPWTTRCPAAPPMPVDPVQEATQAGVVRAVPRGPVRGRGHRVRRVEHAQLEAARPGVDHKDAGSSAVHPAPPSPPGDLGQILAVLAGPGPVPGTRMSVQPGRVGSARDPVDHVITRWNRSCCSSPPCRSGSGGAFLDVPAEAFGGWRARPGGR